MSVLKVIIAGSRTITDCNIVLDAIAKSSFFPEPFDTDNFQIVSGNSRGVDKIGEAFAHIYGIDCKVFKADWKKYGKQAGPIRNRQMGNYADCLIAIRKGESKGTTHMINYMRELGKPVFVVDL